MKLRGWLVMTCLCWACGGGGGGDATVDPGPADVPADVPTDGTAEVAPDVVPPADVVPDALPDEGADVVPDAVPDAEPDVSPDAGPDVTPDVPHELPALPTQAPLATPTDPLKDTGLESCGVIDAQRCQGGKSQTCAVYDTNAKAFEAAPDPLVRRAFLFDRWRDLYNSPDGMAIDRSFNGPTSPGEPEADWGKPERFDGFWGTGDGGIWTGWSAVAAVLRYGQTGTQADYQRMEDLVRTQVAMYEVTGVPGYFIRFHYLLLPKDAPRFPDQYHVLRWEGQEALGHHDRDIVPEALPLMPAIYRDGIVDGTGKVWKGRPMWHGRPSIDQNTGPMTSLPMAYDLLKDDALKQKVSYHLTCYLKRLQRVEIINLQQNPDLLKTLMQYFSAGELKLDPDDLDLTKLDRVVGYVQRQINTANEATFDRTCPATVQMEPWRVIDAADQENFLADMLTFVNDMGTDGGGENQIDHYYFPNLRGGDAVHLMHLAAMAYHMTGDEQYRTFLYDELIGNLKTIEVAKTAGAFDLPKWCKSFFGDQITYGPWWNFLELLGDSPLRTEMQKAFHGELWTKTLKGNGNTDFDIMMLGTVPESIATDRAEALSWVQDQLPRMGGNGRNGDAPVLDDPRRSYNVTPQYVLAHTPDGINPVCPTEAEFKVCTAEIDFMGIKLPGLASFDYVPCTGDPLECVLSNGKCTRAQASGPLPVDLRPYTDFLWQRNPFAIGAWTGTDGGTQYAGSDVSEPFWNAVRYGLYPAGKGRVLAWKDGNNCR